MYFQKSLSLYKNTMCIYIYIYPIQEMFLHKCMVQWFEVHGHGSNLACNQCITVLGTNISFSQGTCFELMIFLFAERWDM